MGVLDIFATVVMPYLLHCAVALFGLICNAQATRLKLPSRTIRSNAINYSIFIDFASVSYID